MSLLETLATTPVTELAHRAPVFAEPDLRIGDAIERMVAARRGAVVVTDADRTVLGILTEHDLARRVDHGDPEWRDRPVSSLMSSPVAVVAEGASIAAAIGAMHEGAHRHLPMVDDQDRATGIVSARDILGFLTALFPQDFVNLPPDPEHEAQRRWGG